MAAGIDDNEEVVRQPRQRGGCNNQMKMMFDGDGGWGQSPAVTMENGNAAERSTAAVMDNGKATA
jgi:hypothetical protein